MLLPQATCSYSDKLNPVIDYYPAFGISFGVPHDMHCRVMIYLRGIKNEVYIFSLNHMHALRTYLLFCFVLLGWRGISWLSRRTRKPWTRGILLRLYERAVSPKFSLLENPMNV